MISLIIIAKSNKQWVGTYEKTRMIIMDMDTVMKTAVFCFLLGWTNGNGQLLHTAMVSLHLRIMDWNIWKMNSCLI